MEAEAQEKTLTLKGIRNTVIVAVISCIILTVCTSLITINSFYYNTTNDVENLKKVSAENTCSIKSLNDAVYSMSANIERINTPTSVNSVEIKNLSERMDKFERAIDKLSDKIDKMIDGQSRK